MVASAVLVYSRDGSPLLNRTKQGRRLSLDKSKLEPAKNVIHDRLGITKLWLLGPATGLEAGVRELVAEQLEGNTVLQRQRNADGKAVHHSGERRTFLCHDDEDFAW